MKEWIEICDAGDPRTEAFFRLTGAPGRAKNEAEKGIFISEAETVIEVALEEGIFPVSVFCVRDMISDRAEALIARCAERNPDLDVFVAGREVFSRLTGFELTRGILAAMRRPEALNAEKLCRTARRVAVLEEVSDAGNIGAIFRSAAGLGVDALLLTRSCCDPFLRRSIRVSMGTVLKMPWAYLDAPGAGVEALRAAGFTTVALALTKDALPIGDERFAKEEKLALYLGSEGYGLKSETVAACDCTAIIPMSRGVDSLNVAAAAAVAFFETRYRG